MEDHKAANHQFIGFLVAVVLATGLTHVVFIKDKATHTAERAVLELIHDSALPALHTLQSDRERAIASQKFQDSIRTKYGVRFQFLAKGSKAGVRRGRGRGKHDMHQPSLVFTGGGAADRAFEKRAVYSVRA